VAVVVVKMVVQEALGEVVQEAQLVPMLVLLVLLIQVVEAVAVLM
tara:strand:- start:123 stop:257 length:135 start_codon:yes stop_codon:yes gene_type:complete